MLTRVLLLLWLAVSGRALLPSHGMRATSHRHHHRLIQAATTAKNTMIEQPPVDERLLAMSRFLVSFWTRMAAPDDAADTTASDLDSSSNSNTMTLAHYNMTRNDVKGFLNHFQACRDYAADNAFVMAMKDENGQDALFLNKVDFPLAVEDENAEEWGQFDKSEEFLGKIETVPTPSFPAEHDDAIVLEDTKRWVRKVMADFGVCPFTVNAESAGIPMGAVRYSVSRATTAEEAFLAFWQDVEALLAMPEREISTVLTIFPELGMFGDYEFFEEYCNCLSDSLSASSMGMEREVQLVFFHPKFVFRDGQARSGEEKGAANFARRGPWPMVNILRTPQVRAAQKGIPTGLVYAQNEERLSQVGAGALERMLYNRDWEGLPSHAHKAKKIREKAERMLDKIRSGEGKEEGNSFNNEEEEEGGGLHDSQQRRHESGEEESDVAREAEICRILALADQLEEEDRGGGKGSAIKGEKAAAAAAAAAAAGEGGGGGKCPFTESSSTQKQQGSDSSSELRRLVESDPATQLSVEEMLRLAEEVDLWMQQGGR